MEAISPLPAVDSFVAYVSYLGARATTFVAFKIIKELSYVIHPKTSLPSTAAEETGPEFSTDFTPPPVAAPLDVASLEDLRVLYDQTPNVQALKCPFQASAKMAVSVPENSLRHAGTALAELVKLSEKCKITIREQVPKIHPSGVLEYKKSMDLHTFREKFAAYLPLDYNLYVRYA